MVRFNSRWLAGYDETAPRRHAFEGRKKVFAHVLTYFEPARLYVAAAGTAILAVAAVVEWRRGLSLTGAPEQIAGPVSREA
jgi:hypothetical protein